MNLDELDENKKLESMLEGGGTLAAFVHQISCVSPQHFNCPNAAKREKS